MPVRRASPESTGRNIATIGVLLMNAESPATGSTSRAWAPSAVLGRPSRGSVSMFIAPVSLRPVATM